MFKSYWIIAVAFGLVFSSSPAFSQGGVQNGENGGDTQTEQAAKQQKPSFVTAIEGVESAIRELIRAESEEERQRQADQAAQDLEAQAEMAEWAREVGIGTVASALFTLGGLILIWFTLGHTKRAANYARDMVKEAKATTAAAQETVIATRDIGEKQVRAYLSIVGVTVDVIIQDGFAWWQCHVSVSNTGQSPASNLNIRIALDNWPMRNNALILGDLGGSTEVTEKLNERTSLNDLVIVDEVNRITTLSVYTHVRGKDVFGKPIEAKAWFAGPVQVAHGLRVELERGREVRLGPSVEEQMSNQSQSLNHPSHPAV